MESFIEWLFITGLTDRHPTKEKIPYLVESETSLAQSTIILSYKGTYLLRSSL